MKSVTSLINFQKTKGMLDPMWDSKESEEIWRKIVRGTILQMPDRLISNLLARQLIENQLMESK